MMLARSQRVRLFAASLAVVTVLGVIGAYAARDNLIRYTLNPSRAFSEGARTAEPDYATANHWSGASTEQSKRADVFFVYPTLYFSGEHWNAPVSNSRVRERLSHIIAPLYAAPFTSAANLHMPIYRQAAPYSFMSSGEDGRLARQLAYEDVSRAFKEFLKNRNKGRPFIIAGYGQGALYGFRLISELSAEDKGRLIAAYLMEVAIPLELTREMAKGTPLCDASDQIGCMIIWYSTTQHARNDLPRQNALVWRADGGFDATRGRELACVNPLTWTVSGRAGAAETNLGAAELSEFGTGTPTITRALTSADCWNGLLFIDVSPEPTFLWAGPRYRELFPAKMNPFFADIQDNVSLRIEAYLAKGAGQSVDEAPLQDEPEEFAPIDAPEPELPSQ